MVYEVAMETTSKRESGLYCELSDEHIYELSESIKLNDLSNNNYAEVGPFEGNVRV